MTNTFQNLWLRDRSEPVIYINETAVKIRAGMLLFIPLYMALVLFDVAFTSHWIVDGNTAVDTFELDWYYNIIYTVEAIKRTYDYTIPTIILFYALFEMIAGMFVATSRLSPTILLSSFLAKKSPPVWKPLKPKRMAWSIGAVFIIVCIIFFNPDTFANIVNGILNQKLLSTTENFMPYWIPLYLVWICIGLMWFEAVLGFCLGCYIHAQLVKIGVFTDECESCNNIDWDEIARKHKEKLEAEDLKKIV